MLNPFVDDFGIVTVAKVLRNLSPLGDAGSLCPVRTLMSACPRIDQHLGRSAVRLHPPYDAGARVGVIYPSVANQDAATGSFNRSEQHVNIAASHTVPVEAVAFLMVAVEIVEDDVTAVVAVAFVVALPAAIEHYVLVFIQVGNTCAQRTAVEHVQVAAFARPQTLPHLV